MTSSAAAANPIREIAGQDVEAIRRELRDSNSCAAAGDRDVKAPEAFAALRQFRRDRPVLEELRAVGEAIGVLGDPLRAQDRG